MDNVSRSVWVVHHEGTKDTNPERGQATFFEKKLPVPCVFCFFFAYFAYFAVKSPIPNLFLCDLCTTIVENVRRLRKLCNHAIAAPPPQGVS